MTLTKECFVYILRMSGCVAGCLLFRCCLSGEYCPNDGMTGPLACPSGTYTLTSGQSACTDCNPGAATALVALCCFQQQYNCITGSLRKQIVMFYMSYNARMLMNYIHPVGHACTDATTSGTACSAGTYQPSYGSTTCIDVSLP